MIFRHNLVKLRLQKAEQDIVQFKKSSNIYDFSRKLLEDMLDGLEIAEVQNIIVLADRGDIIRSLIEDLTASSKFNNLKSNFYYADVAELVMPEENVDLIISFFDLNWADNIHYNLMMYHELLKKGGILIGCFLAEGSLFNLKHKFFELENILTGKHYSHTSPLINHLEFIGLLQQSQYHNIMVMIDRCESKYTNFLSLLKNLKNMGASNALQVSSNYQIPKKVYQAILEDKSLFEEQFIIASFSARKITDYNI